MIHVRIVAPAEQAEQALELLDESEAVCNVIHFEGAARRPERDVILADIAREDASVVLDDLKALGIPRVGSIAIEEIDTQISDQADRAIKLARGAAGDAVVWEEVEQHTSENVELSGVFLAFMVIAAQLAMVGIFEDSAILIVGAMVVGPEFGPLAGFCVAAVQRRPQLALRSALALGAGFPLAITGVWLATLAGRATGVFPDDFSTAEEGLGTIIADPNFLSFFVAVCAGIAGMLSLSTAKSGALIGVLISVTTIPAAANIGIAAAYREGDAWLGSIAQLGINLCAIVLAGVTTLAVQRALYRRRKTRYAHEHDLAHGTVTASTRSRPSSAPSRSPRR